MSTILSSHEIARIQALALQALSLQVTGYNFTGAHPEAERAGLEVDSIQGRIFTNEFVEGLPTIYLDSEGKIK